MTPAPERTDDPLASALTAAAAIRRGEISPLELLDAAIARVAERNAALNAVLWDDPEPAREAARSAGDAIVGGDPRELPAFYGVPMPIKDLTTVAGWPTTYGSWGAPDTPSKRSAPVVDALQTAGFLLCGRTTTSEFGALSSTESVRYGITRNPWDITATPGGSSGGAAAAVSSRMFPAAHGSDGGGSIRVPAACTGLVGLKVSRGRVPSRVRHWEGTVVEGVLTRDVADTAAILDVISHPDPGAWYNAPPPERSFISELGCDPGRLRIGLQTSVPFGLPLHPDCRTAVVAIADVLSDAGHVLADVSLALLTPAAISTFVELAEVGRSATPGIDWQRTEPHVRAAHERAHRTSSVHYAQTLDAVQDFSRQLLPHWGRGFDVLLTPTMATVAPPAGVILDKSHADISRAPLELLQMTAFTTMANLVGLPSISLPLGQTPDGMPVGIMLTAGPWNDGVLIRLAAQLEQLSPWRERVPARV